MKMISADNRGTYCWQICLLVELVLPVTSMCSAQLAHRVIIISLSIIMVLFYIEIIISFAPESSKWPPSVEYFCLNCGSHFSPYSTYPADLSVRSLLILTIIHEERSSSLLSLCIFSYSNPLLLEWNWSLELHFHTSSPFFYDASFHMHQNDLKYKIVRVMWYSGIWNSHPISKVSKKIFYFYKVIQKQICVAHMFTCYTAVLPAATSSATHHPS
jgi:hypothetical protein